MCRWEDVARGNDAEESDGGKLHRGVETIASYRVKEMLQMEMEVGSKLSRFCKKVKVAGRR